MKKRILATIVLLVIVVMALSACSSTGGDPTAMNRGDLISVLTGNAKKIKVVDITSQFADPGYALAEKRQAGGDNAIVAVDPASLPVVASPLISEENGALVIWGLAATELSGNHPNDLAVKIINDLNAEKRKLPDGRYLQFGLIQSASGVTAKIIQKYGFGGEANIQFVITTTGMWGSVMENSGRRQIKLIDSNLVKSIMVYTVENGLLEEIAGVYGVPTSGVTADMALDAILDGKVEAGISATDPDKSSTGAHLVEKARDRLPALVRAIGKNLASNTTILSDGAAARKNKFIVSEWQAEEQRSDRNGYTRLIVDDEIPHTGYVWAGKDVTGDIEDGIRQLIAAFKSESGQKLARERFFTAPMSGVADLSQDTDLRLLLNSFQRQVASLSLLDVCLGIDISSTATTPYQTADGDEWIRPLDAVADGLEATAESIGVLADSGVSLGVWLMGSDITSVIPLSPIDDLTPDRLYAVAEYLRHYEGRNTTRVADALTVMTDALLSYDSMRDTAASGNIIAIQRLVIISDCKDEPGFVQPIIPFDTLVQYLNNPALGIQRIPIALKTPSLDEAALNKIAPADSVDGSIRSLPSIDEMAAEVRTQLTYLLR